MAVIANAVLLAGLVNRVESLLELIEEQNRHSHVPLTAPLEMGVMGNLLCFEGTEVEDLNYWLYFSRGEYVQIQ